MSDLNIKEIRPLAPVNVIFEEDSEIKECTVYIDYLSNKVILLSCNSTTADVSKLEQAILKAHKEKYAFISKISAPENITDYTVDKMANMKEKYVRKQQD